MTATLYAPIGPPMRIDWGCPFVVQGQRFRSSARAVLDLTGRTITVRVGPVGEECLIELDLALDDSDADDPSYYGTMTAEQTQVEPSAAYEYTIKDSDGRLLLSGPAEVVDHTRDA